MAVREGILRCPACGFQIRGHPTQYLTRRTVLCPMCRTEAPLTEEDRLRLKRLTADGAARGPDPPPPGAAPPRPRGSPSGTGRRPGGHSGARPAQPGAFSPSSRRDPRYPARLPAWWAAQRGAQGLPAETVNVSSAGLRLALEQPPAAPSSFGWRPPWGRSRPRGGIAWVQREAGEHQAGVAPTRLPGPSDRRRWEHLISRLAERVAHA